MENIKKPENFIRVYDKAFSPEFCKSVIEYYEWCQTNNKTWPRDDDNIVRKDDACTINPASSLEFDWTHTSWLLKEFNSLFWSKYYKSYCEEFSTLKKFGGHTIFTYKVQKTEPGGGYHVWHAEQDQRGHAVRIAVYTIYLNDVLDGGETEFLYQGVRVPSRTGKLCIFPSSYSHTHRGNPPLSGTKYVLTGWIEFN